MIEPDPSYSYRAQILRWVDGDTVDLAVDCGFRLTTHKRFRLWGIEVADPGCFIAARDYAQTLAPVGSVHTVHTFNSSDVGGRYQVLIHLARPSNEEPQTLNDALVEVGYARPYLRWHPA